jgi:hypothetical protein
VRLRLITTHGGYQHQGDNCPNSYPLQG